MNEITQIRKLSLWIFFIPLIAINFCLYVSQNYEFLENTFFTVDQIGRSGFSIPYIDGSLSISRASRTFPQYLVFKPAMIITAITLYFYWSSNNVLVNKLNLTNIDYKFKTFGILSAIFLAILDIFSPPSSCLDTHAFFQNTNAKANIPNKGRYDTIISMIFIFLFCVYISSAKIIFLLNNISLITKYYK